VAAWKPRFLGPSAEELRTYRSGEHVVSLYVAHYRASGPSTKLASEGNALLGAHQWVSVDHRVSVRTDGGIVRRREVLVRASGEPALRIWSWYYVNGTETASDHVAKLLLAGARLFRNPRGASALAIAIEERPGVAAAAILEDFQRHMVVNSLSDLPIRIDNGRRAGEIQ
jgi:EpsI family protein